jgi:hypothetical protein
MASWLDSDCLLPSRRRRAEPLSDIRLSTCGNSRLIPKWRRVQRWKTSRSANRKAETYSISQVEKCWSIPVLRSQVNAGGGRSFSPIYRKRTRFGEPLPNSHVPGANPMTANLLSLSRWRIPCKPDCRFGNGRPVLRAITPDIDSRVQPRGVIQCASLDPFETRRRFHVARYRRTALAAKAAFYRQATFANVIEDGEKRSVDFKGAFLNCNQRREGRATLPLTVFAVTNGCHDWFCLA